MEEQFSSSDHAMDTTYSKMISFVLYVILSLHELSLSLSFIICAIRLPSEPHYIIMLIYICVKVTIAQNG